VSAHTKSADVCNISSGLCYLMLPNAVLLRSSCGACKALPAMQTRYIMSWHQRFLPLVLLRQPIHSDLYATIVVPFLSVIGPSGNNYAA